jgi:SpoVK/Ycf46/Vps4 family AAA+-type ATPase
MKYLIEFMESDNIIKTEIFSQLKCTSVEAQVLRMMTKEYLAGSAELGVMEVLIANFGKDNFAYIKEVDKVRDLIDLGWVVLNSLHNIKTSEISSLELMHNTISLSSAYLKLLEEGGLEFILPEKEPYKDHLEYMQDQFFKIELYQKLLQVRQSYDQASPNFKRLKSKLTLMENQITERIKITEEPLKLEVLFEEKIMGEKEQIIFLALLKEEYSATDDNLRDMNTLIDLISFDDYEKIKNREILDETSPLLEQSVIDYDEVITFGGGIGRSFFINDEILQDIIHPKKKKKTQKIKLSNFIKEQEMFEHLDPKTTLEDVVLHPETRKTLDTLLRQMDKNVFGYLKEWGLRDRKAGIKARIIFHGFPGTGKTLTALSLSKSLKRPVISFDCSKILSMYIGESEKNVRKIFDSYQEIVDKTKSEPVLLLNEADQFLSARVAGTGSSADKMHNQMQNIFLEQIERFPGVLIATTNLLENIDTAFSRRFNYKVQFEKPNEAQRVELWKKHLPQKAPYADDIDIEALAVHKLTGGQINLIVENTAYKVAAKDEVIFTQEDFVNEIKIELKGSFGTSEKSMGFLS